VFAIAAELGTVRAACRSMGIHPSTCYRWKRQLDRHGPEILAQALPPRAAAEDCTGGDALSHPAEVVDLAEAIHGRYRVLMFVGAYGGLRIGGLAGLRPRWVDLLAGGGHRGRDPHRGQRQADRRPTQDARRPANRRAAALRRP
jgi:Helix-turn-helix domain